MSNSLTKQLQRKAQNMDFADFLYYEIKELQQQYDFWEAKTYRPVAGAKVRARNLLNKIRDTKEVLRLHEAESNTVLVNFLYKH